MMLVIYRLHGSYIQHSFASSDLNVNSPYHTARVHKIYQDINLQATGNLWDLDHFPVVPAKHMDSRLFFDSAVAKAPSKNCKVRSHRPWCDVSHWHGAYVGDCWFSCCHLAANHQNLNLRISECILWYTLFL